MTSCPRAWEVEAARDGRLVGKARDALDGHVRDCPSCARDAEALENVARGLRDLGGAPCDDVAIRRLRNRVLDAADAEQTGRLRSDARRGRMSARSVALALAAVLVTCVALVFSLSRAHRGPAEVTSARVPDVVAAPAAPLTTSPGSEASEGSRVDVSPGDGARYTRTTEAAVDRFRLLHGTLRLRVQRPPGGRRVVVAVPDGEIEDVGTVFEVVVADGHTEQVSVEEGRVVVRLTDRAAVTVEAGTAWRRPVAVRAKAKVDGGASATAPVAASSRGEREDEAYLDVLRLMREGRDVEARAAASRYLHEFPTGFRHSEMERVATLPRPR
jgi:hypothetical protein